MISILGEIMDKKIELEEKAKGYYSYLVEKSLEYKFDDDVKILDLMNQIIVIFDSLKLNIANQIQLQLYKSITKMLNDFYYSLFSNNFQVVSLFLRMISENMIIFSVMLNNDLKVTEYWQYWEFMRLQETLKISDWKYIPEFLEFRKDLNNNFSTKEIKNLLRKNYGWAVSLGLNANSCTLKQISLKQQNDILYKIFSEVSNRVHNSSFSQFISNIDTSNTFIFFCSEFISLTDVLIEILTPFITNQLEINNYKKLSLQFLLNIS